MQKSAESSVTTSHEISAKHDQPKQIPSKLENPDASTQSKSNGIKKELSKSNSIAERSSKQDLIGPAICGRERLKRHRVDVAGRVWIPEMWGQEDFLKDWIDCTMVDPSLTNNSLMSARAALVEEGRRANSASLRIENSC